ncbi:MAG: hypothetical protein ABUK01_03675 [Leptospirales bacterium]
MKYHSKSPKEFIKDHKDDDQKRQTRLSGGRKLLLLDVFLLVLLAILFVYITKGSFNSGEEDIENIEWKNWTLSASCEESSCELKIIVDMEDIAGIGVPVSVSWVIKGPNNEVLFEESRELSSTGSAIYRNDLLIPKDWPDGNIFAVISAEKAKEKITIQAYP